MPLDTNADPRGACANSPGRLPATAWREILARAWRNVGRHNVGLMAAGVAFYAFLSFVPLLAALIMTYGLFADTAAVAEHMQRVTALVPSDAAHLINDQLAALTQTAAATKGWRLLVALCVSIYGASRASGALMSALNVVYEQEESRATLSRIATSALLIVGAVVIGIAGVIGATGLSIVSSKVAAAGPVAATAAGVISWLAAAMFFIGALAAMYRYAPNRADARWEWVGLGSVLATILWLLVTIGLGVYVSSFAHYDATYGSLAAVVVLLMWLFLSAYSILIGALINAEAERQTARDTTTGPERPIGQRGAVMADTSVAMEEPMRAARETEHRS